MRKTLFAAMASAGLLVACGGGGGSDAVGTTDTPVSTAAAVSLSGTAAKGLMANADVNVYAVKADGSVDTSVSLGHALTGSDGKYSLSFSGTKDQPYVVVVTANANTTHLDEVTGQTQALPAGFTMRSLVVPASTGSVTTSASITPFSEMAVAAAAKASGGVTAANAAQAISTVTQLLGFNPTAVAATTLGAASGADEQKLAVMLTAVSQLANSGDLGCSTGSAGDKTQCVVQALAASASKDSIKLGDSSNDVSAKLSTAVTTVLNDDTVRAQVDASVLTTVVANLACTSNCTAAPVGTTPDAPSATATAIAAARLLFGELKTDWAAMFSQGGASSIAGGAVNQEAFKFNTAMSGVQVPVKVMAKDLGTLLMGVDLYNDYKAGRTTNNGRSRGTTGLVDSNGSVPDDGAWPAGCTLYQDANTTTPANAPGNANFIGCGARYYVSWAPGANGATIVTEWRHGFTLTPNADGSFSYTTAARRRVQNCVTPPNTGCTQTANVALQKDASNNVIAFSGTLTPTLSAAYGDILSFTLSGDLPAAFESGGSALLAGSYKHSVSFSGTQTVNADRTVDSTLRGSIAVVDAAGATQSTLTVKDGSVMSQIPVSVNAQGTTVPWSANLGGGAHTMGGLSLNLVFSRGGSEFEGLFAITRSGWDKSQTELWPLEGRLSGALRNTGSNGSTEFLSGVLTATATGIADYDVTLPKSAGNSYTVNIGFVGTITAPNRPTLELSAGSGWINDSAAGRPIALTMQYRTLVAGVPRLVVSLVGDRNVAGDLTRVTLSEATSKLSLPITVGASSADLLLDGSTRIGTLTASNGLLTFSDNSFMSLDIGL